MQENWRDVTEFPDHYEVSDKGRVRTKARFNRRPYPSVIRKTPLVCGYPSLILSVNGITYRRPVHRLVLKAFGIDDKERNVCNHKDGNRTNNNIENLEWVTTAENLRHSREVLGNIPGASQKLMHESDITKARELRINGMPMKAIGTLFGVSESCIHKLTKDMHIKNMASGTKHFRFALTADMLSRIKELRSCGQSQQKIADDLGIGQTTVSRAIRTLLS